jgi:hypothetical protein
MPRAEFAFVQARLQSRHGDALRATNWQAIEASRGVAQFLAAVRAGALAPWVEGFDESFGAHRIERTLRSRWAGYVEQLVRWQPAPWRALTRWFGVLPELGLIDAWRQSGVFASPSPRAKAGAEDLLAAFAVPYAPTGERSTVAIWRAEWERRAPPPRPDIANLIRPAHLLLPALGGDHSGRGAAAEPVRAALVRLLRRFAATPIAVFAHLALVALDVERLRGGLLVREMFARE